MKKILSIAAIFIVTMLTVSACFFDDEDDEEEEPDTELSVIGKWSIIGTATDDGEEYTYTGIMDISSTSLTVDFKEAVTDYHAAILQEKCTFSGNTIKWGTSDEYEVFIYSLSADENTLTMTYSSGDGLDGYIIRTMTAKRIGSNTNDSNPTLLSALKGTWKSSYYISNGGEAINLSKYSEDYDLNIPEGGYWVLDNGEAKRLDTQWTKDESTGTYSGLVDDVRYNEFVFDGNGNAQSWSWAGGDDRYQSEWTYEDMAYRVDSESGNVIVDYASFLDLDNDNGSTGRRIFTYDSTNSLLVETVTVSGEDENYVLRVYYTRSE